MIRIVLLFYLLLLNGLVFAQQTDSLETVAVSPEKETKKNSWKLLLGLDGRRSVVLNESTLLGGLKIGATLNKKHKMGIGIYWMKDDIVRHGAPGLNITDATGDLFFKFGYTSLFYEPVLFRNKRWQLSTPVHLGSAVIELRYLNSLDQRVLFQTTKAPLFELSGVAQYKILRWLAIGTGLGYRGLLVNDQRIKQALNAPVYILQLKILFGVIWKTILDKEIDDDWEE